MAGLLGLLAVIGALLLPFAPVSVNEPTVTWPREPAQVESTSLAPAAYRPLTLDVRFSCGIAELAAATGDGVIVSTALPGSPEAGTSSLLVTAADGRITVNALDRLLLDEPLSTQPCEYRITGRSAGLPSYTGVAADPADPPGPDLEAFAAADQAELVISRDGRELARVDDEQLPDVDVLLSSLATLPAEHAGELSVTMRVDDEFTSSPTPLKQALLVGVGLAMLGTVVALVRIDAVLLARVDRAAARPPRQRGRWRPRPLAVTMDLLVAAVLVGWAVVAPVTSDDAYFAAQARNAALSGEVGNYYQFYDQSFVPFTWVYQLLSWWQQLAGLTPLAQRTPALVAGIALWIVLRRYLALALRGVELGDIELGGWVRTVAPVVLAVTYLTWWVPQNMGVRPEAVVALLGAATLLAVLIAAHRARLAVAWLACALAGAGFTAHTTGITMFAPLLVGLPLLWPLLRIPGSALRTGLRVLAVGSGGMTALLLGFTDGALRDFLRGQVRFTSALNQQDWTDEALRYDSLLGQVVMGNFAKRAAILVCLLALAWFVVLAVAARARRIAVPVPLWLAAGTTALSFALLSLTPSKWTHHFGALAGVGPAFLTLFLVLAVPLTREVLRGDRLPPVVPVVAGISTAGVLALTWHGPNSWPFAWLDGVRTPNQPPALAGVTFDGPLLWALLLVLVAAAAVLVRRRAGPRRLRALTAVPVVVVLSFIGTLGYTLTTFGVAAVRGVPHGSVWAQNLADPWGCGAADAIQVLDPATARPLTSAGLAEPALPEGFVAGGGFYENNRPQGGPDGFWTGPVWGSLVGLDGASADLTTGAMSTSWFGLPTGDDAVIVTAAGTLSEGNALTATYGRRVGNGSDVAVTVGSQQLTDTARSPVWRTFVLDPPDSADVVRLDAVDTTGALHGWLAFTAPATATPTTLAEFLPAQAPVALGWQVGFGLPCARQPALVNGIIESPTHAVLWGGPNDNQPGLPPVTLGALSDITFQVARGAAFGHVPRSRSILQPATVGPIDPNTQVYVFGTDLAPDAYVVRTESRTKPGAEVAW